jgi:hypothetical protein
MIEWPAIIKHEGDDELICISSADEWTRDSGSYLYNHSGNNLLIDSKGNIFNLANDANGGISADKTGRIISLEDFIRLVRIHASTINRCCIEKISFRSIADGVKLIASMNEPG